MPLHLLRCQGLAVDDYSFALGRLEAGTPSTFAQLGLERLLHIYQMFTISQTTILGVDFLQILNSKER